MVKKGAERREAERAEIEIDVNLGAYGKYHLTRMTNVSIGGAFIRTQTLEDVGTPVRLKFKLPGERSAIEISGEVVWVYNQAGSREYNSTGMGIRFKQVNEKERKR